MRKFVGASIVTIGIALATSPASAAQYLFSYGFNGTTIASGSIFTDNSAVPFPGGLNVTQVTGNRFGVPIDHTPSYFEADYGDQEIYPTSSTGKVDGNGLTYQIGAYSYNIYQTGTNFYSEFRYLTADTYPQQGDATAVSFFNLTLVTNGAVPEPATWAMLVVGFAAVGAAARRRRVRVAFRPA